MHRASLLRQMIRSSQRTYSSSISVCINRRSILSPQVNVLLESQVAVKPCQISHVFMSTGSNTRPEILEKIGKLVKEGDVVVFMKGVPDSPRCGFSNAVVQILRMHDVKFSSHDVLQDEEIRQGIKDFSNWPTIPQVYFKGEFIGGCDILLEMHKNGELIDELDKIGIKSALLTENKND